MDESLFSWGTVEVKIAVIFSPVVMALSHLGQGRMRPTRLMSLRWSIFTLGGGICLQLEG